MGDVALLVVFFAFGLGGFDLVCFFLAFGETAPKEALDSFTSSYGKEVSFSLESGLLRADPWFFMPDIWKWWPSIALKGASVSSTIIY